VRSWDVTAVDLRPHSPEIHAGTDETRAVVLEIPAGDGLREHQVHERAGVSVIDGEVEITTTRGEKVAAGSGLLVEFERDGRSDGRRPRGWEAVATMGAEPEDGVAP
jgi:hypothetical protein